MQFRAVDESGTPEGKRAEDRPWTSDGKFCRHERQCMHVAMQILSYAKRGSISLVRPYLHAPLQHSRPAPAAGPDLQKLATLPSAPARSARGRALRQFWRPRQNRHRQLCRQNRHRPLRRQNKHRLLLMRRASAGRPAARRLRAGRRWLSHPLG